MDVENGDFTSGGQKYVAGIALGIDTTGLLSFWFRRTGLVWSTLLTGRSNAICYRKQYRLYEWSVYQGCTITNAKVGDLQSTNFVSGRLDGGSAKMERLRSTVIAAAMAIGYKWSAD